MNLAIPFFVNLFVTPVIPLCLEAEVNSTNDRAIASTPSAAIIHEAIMNPSCPCAFAKIELFLKNIPAPMVDPTEIIIAVR